jgi:hypothetical protein
MKRLLLLLLLSTPAFADAVGRSSFTITNDTTKHISGTQPSSVLMEVIVSSPTVGGLLRIYDSQGSATSQVANVTLQNAASYNFDLIISSGITYTTTLNGNGVTMIWRK